MDDKLHFLKGWFKDTLQDAPTQSIALLRLDGDLYESTMDTLMALYDRVSDGGVVIVDDYGALEVCRQAVADFFTARGEPLPQLHEIDWTGAYFLKPSTAESAQLKRSFTTAFTAPMLDGYQSGVMSYTYRGTRCLKSPIDIALYMKLLWDLKPNLVLEIGSHSGGSALLLADLVTSFGLNTSVVSIDLEVPKAIDDDRIRFLQGDIQGLEDLVEKYDLSKYPHPWFITEDSAHSYSGCMTALQVLSEHMHPGDIIAIEDGVLEDLGMSDKYQGGPNRAIATYMTRNPGQFRIMTELCDMFGPNATYNPNGYLCKL